MHTTGGHRTTRVQKYYYSSLLSLPRYLLLGISLYFDYNEYIYSPSVILHKVQMLKLDWQWHVSDDTFLGKLQGLDLGQGLDNHCRKQK